MSAERIALMLQKAMGLDRASVGSGIILSAIRKRMRATGVTDEERFLALLQESADEMKAMIEEVVVPETWFFRNEAAFRLMVKHLSGKWRSAHPDRIHRLLSMPCSSGEEPYSMAMALLDAGFRADGFQIDAIDISNQNLEKARKAVYGKGSFRGGDLEFRRRYFNMTEAGYRLHSQVRSSVRFHQVNILDHSQVNRLGSYDIIFCRNLLIYFNQDDRDRTAGVLSKMLNQDGLLFVGHAETGLMWKQHFAAVSHSMAFAYRSLGRDESASPVSSEKARSRTGLAPKSTLPQLDSILSRSRKKTVKPIKVVSERNIDSVKVAQEKRPSLEEASRLADQGRLDEARQQCEGYLKTQSGSAQAWFLMGLILDTQGEKERAKDGFRKALYLDPNHYEALVHLALLLDQGGELKAAEQLRARMQRLKGRQRAQS
ncbi:MCP methyltransferase, CheR-type [Mariprofundus ferrinatatus]|uniref:MCP methyltransferase, CheR-type n=1 Tax=Mariprofundus ferrinatatus TaxID=1921087 RepID=A0A2K8LEK6_9PROT|nr:protein-glutamate O-methyltransferase CheR [Mariprofundus ferrinatatus]ATX82706.1 MCP methyltransferase, CheR-type [Mariprofundus ferrinatatus]